MANIQARIVVICLVSIVSFYAGVKITNNARDAELYAEKKHNERLAIQRGQEAADIIQEVMDEKSKERVVYRTKYIDRIRIVERNNKCKLDDDSLQLWQEAINRVNAKAFVFDAAMPATTANQ